MNFCCPKCDQFWDRIKHHGYTIKKISTTTESILRSSLDQGNSLVICGCSECKIPREVAQVLSSPVTVSWNVLRLCRTGSESTLQSNGVVQMTVIDLDNGEPMDEVLAWLETKLHRRNSNASYVSSQRRELST